MNFGIVFVIGLFILGIIGTIYSNTHYSGDHTSLPQGRPLRKNAKIVDFQQKGHHYKGKMAPGILTRVYFEDGFVFECNDCLYTAGGVYANETLNRQIVAKAIAAHDTACERQSLRK